MGNILIGNAKDKDIVYALWKHKDVFINIMILFYNIIIFAIADGWSVYAYINNIRIKSIVILYNTANKRDYILYIKRFIGE